MSRDHKEQLQVKSGINTLNSKASKLSCFKDLKSKWYQLYLIIIKICKIIPPKKMGNN